MKGVDFATAYFSSFVHVGTGARTSGALPDPMNGWCSSTCGVRLAGPPEQFFLLSQKDHA